MPDPLTLGLFNPLALLVGAAGNALVSYVNGSQIRSSNEELEARRARLALQLKDLDLSHHRWAFGEQRRLQLELSALTRESLRLQTAQQLQNTLHGMQASHALSRWPLRTAPAQILDLVSGMERVPLVVILSPPKLQFDRVAGQGQGLHDMEAGLSAELTGFLNQHYLPHGLERPVRFLGGALETKTFAREALLTALWSFLRSLPVLVIDSEVDGNLLRLNAGGWGTGRETFWYTTIGTLPYRSLLQRSARERAEAFRSRRDELRRLGCGQEEIARLLGEATFTNLDLLDAGKKLGETGSMMTDQLNDRLVPTREDVEEVRRGLHRMHSLLVAGFADLHHLTRYDMEPRLPALLPELATGLPPELQDVFDQTVSRFADSYVAVYAALQQARPAAFAPELSRQFGGVLQALGRHDEASRLIDHSTHASRERNPEIETESFLRSVKRLRDLTQDDPDIQREIDSAIQELERKKAPFIQLYGGSQAGKSTLVSALTLGEQYLPVGTGKATTAVQVEIVGIGPGERAYAAIEWHSPQDLLELMLEPLAPFVDLPEHEQDLSARSLLGVLDLGHNKDRRRLSKALENAERLRRIDAASSSYVVGGANDLAVARILLLHYEQYARQYRPDLFTVSDLSTLPQWTRQPHDWGNWARRPLESYEFEELKSFFTRRVCLHVAGASVLQGLRLVDSPGFGVSRMHDRICREVQEKADAVLLVVPYDGSQMPLDQMNSIRQLAAGLRDNLFLVWNPKVGSKVAAEYALEDELIRLRNEAGLDVPRERAVVVHLLLALRAIQWLRLQEWGPGLSPVTLDALAEMLSRTQRIPPSLESVNERAEYLVNTDLTNSLRVFEPGIPPNGGEDMALQARTASGWDTDGVPLFEVIRKSQQQRHLRACAARVFYAMSHYLTRFPTPQDDDNARRDLRALEELNRRMAAKKKELSEELELDLESAFPKLRDEFLSCLTDATKRLNLESIVENEIRSKLHYSTVPGMMETKLLDHAKARCTVWTQSVQELATRNSKQYILEAFEERVAHLRDWVADEEMATPIELPAAPGPQVSFDAFRQTCAAEFAESLAETFRPDWIGRFLNTLAETGAKVSVAARTAWWKVKKSFTQSYEPKPQERPSFNWEDAVREAHKEIRRFFDKTALEILLERSWEDAQEAVRSATLNAFNDWAELAQKTLKELEKNLSGQLKDLPAPLPRARIGEIEGLLSSLGTEELGLQEDKDKIEKLIQERYGAVHPHPGAPTLGVETLRLTGRLSQEAVP